MKMNEQETAEKEKKTKNCADAIKTTDLDRILY